MASKYDEQYQRSKIVAELEQSIERANRLMPTKESHDLWVALQDAYKAVRTAQRRYGEIS